MPNVRMRDRLPPPLKKRLRRVAHTLRQRSYQAILMFCRCFRISTLPKYGCASVSYLDQLTPLRILSSAEVGTVYAPRTCYSEPPRAYAVPVPELNLYRFENATVSPVSSHIITSAGLILERLPHLDIKHCNYATGAVCYHDSFHALYRRRNTHPLDEGILIAGNGACNYYHWLTEILPKLHEVCRHNLLGYSRTLLLPDCVQTTPAFAHTLQALLGSRDVNLVYLDANCHYRVGRLYTLTSPSAILFNPRRLLADPRYNYYRLASLQAIRKAMLAQLEAYSPAHLRRYTETLQFERKGRRLYLARKADGRRGYNQSQVRELLIEHHDFCEVFLEEYPLEVQVWLFANADLIVGASGAAWANLLFCRAGARAISWLPEHLMDFSAYASLGHYMGVDMVFVPAKTRRPRELHPDHTVPLDELERRVQYALG